MTGRAAAVAGLYAIADTAVLGAARLHQAVTAAIAGGARMVQYRDKSEDMPRRLSQAAALSQLCATYSIPFIVNDDVELAAAVQAAGVHLGRDDTAPEAARRRLGGDAIIGVSCYNELPRAEEAERLGADYVAFGACYPSPTKPGAVRAETALLRRARTRLHCPIVAIGGITPDNAPPLLQAGADAVAVIGALFAETMDTEAAARRFAALFECAGRHGPMTTPSKGPDP